MEDFSRNGRITAPVAKHYEEIHGTDTVVIDIYRMKDGYDYSVLAHIGETYVLRFPQTDGERFSELSQAKIEAIRLVNERVSGNKRISRRVAKFEVLGLMSQLEFDFA